MKYFPGNTFSFSGGEIFQAIVTFVVKKFLSDENFRGVPRLLAYFERACTLLLEEMAHELQSTY